MDRLKHNVELPDYFKNFIKLTDFAVQFRYDFIGKDFPAPDNYFDLVKKFDNFY